MEIVWTTLSIVHMILFVIFVIHSLSLRYSSCVSFVRAAFLLHLTLPARRHRRSTTNHYWPCLKPNQIGEEEKKEQARVTTTQARNRVSFATQWPFDLAPASFSTPRPRAPCPPARAASAASFTAYATRYSAASLYDTTSATTSYVVPFPRLDSACPPPGKLCCCCCFLPMPMPIALYASGQSFN